MQRSLAANRLEHGAYRIASGEKWLALIGDDTDFTPKTPWARRNSEREPKLQGEWEKASELPFAARSQIDARRFRSFVRASGDLDRTLERIPRNRVGVVDRSRIRHAPVGTETSLGAPSA